jgi:hypothetical protein
MLSVVVASIGQAPLARTVGDLQASLQNAGVEGEVVVVWQHAGPPPDLPPVARVVETFPVGLAYARNRGTREATAPLVGFVDDDEAVDTDWAKALLAAFAAHPEAAGVLGAVAPLDDAGRPYCVVDGERERVFRRRSTPPWVVGTGGNMAFRRAVLDDVGGFDVGLGAGAPGRAGEESELFVRLLRGGHTLVWTPHAGVLHPTKTSAEHLASRFPYGYGAGAAARRRRDAGMATRYAAALVQSYRTGLRAHDRQRRREAVRTGAGFAAGLVRGAHGPSPVRVLARMPAAIEAALGTKAPRPETGCWTRQPEFRYRTERLRLRVLPGLTTHAGRDTAVASVVAGDALWLVERR